MVKIDINWLPGHLAKLIESYKKITLDGARHEHFFLSWQLGFRLKMTAMILVI